MKFEIEYERVSNHEKNGKRKERRTRGTKEKRRRYNGVCGSIV